VAAPVAGLDLAQKLAEYARMDARNDITNSQDRSSLPPRPDRARRVVWIIGLVIVTIITVLAFGAYRQPELLLNLMGLRYCG
jgi:hypothetical protein